MSERRAATKGRRLGSSRRKQLQQGSREAPGPEPSPAEEPPWASEAVQRVQQLLSNRGTEQAGAVTRSDLQKLQEEGLPCSREELELVFDGLDAAGSGSLGAEEFTAGLRQFLSSQKAAREHRRRKTASRRVRLLLPAPALEGGDSEERRHFAAFMEQLGTENLLEEQEIWQLWVKLRQDEPQLLDNLEEFLAKMRHHIQEARSEKEALELALNRRVAEHDKDVQQLCEVLEQQIQREQLRLQHQSTARSQQHGQELQRVLDASEREVQRLVTAQRELEQRCHSLHSSQQVTSRENQQLEESNWALEQHLQHLHQQLQHTQGHLRTMRATVVWEPGDRVVAELPIEVPMSPQLSPGKSEKFRSEMRIRLGSQGSQSQARSPHQVVWEMPTEINLSGAPRKASSAEEDPFPEPLKEEGVSEQSSLLREMNDAIAALSKHLKAEALGASPALADTPWDNAELQTGLEAATAHETTPGILQETLPGQAHHELLEGALQEGAATAELRALDVTQAGASTGAGHCSPQEPGPEQGQSPEGAHRMIFLQGKGAAVEDMVLNVAEHLGESTETGEQVMMEEEGAGGLQEKTARVKPQLLGEAEEVEISQRENLGPPEAGQEGVAVEQCLAMDEQRAGRTPGESVQERAEAAPGLPGELQTQLGQHLGPEPPPWAQAGGGVPEVTVAPGVLDEECARREVQPRGETTDCKVLEVLPSSRAGGEEEEVEEAEAREAEQQLQGEGARGDAEWRGSEGTLEPLAAAVPPTHGQGGVGTDVELMEAQSSTNVELLAEVEADLQVWNEAGSPGTQQGEGVDPGVQLEKDKPEAGLGGEMGAAAVHSEGPAPAETPVGSPGLCGLLPVKSQALQLVEADLQVSGGLSPETPQGGEGARAVQIEGDEEEDGAQGQGEHGLPHEPVPHPGGLTWDQGEGAGEDMQAQEEAENLDTMEDQSSGANVQLIAEGDELSLTPGGSTEADLQHMGEAGSSGTEQGGRLDSDVQPLDEEGKAELVEGEVEDAQEDMIFHEGPSPGAPWGWEGGRAVQLEEEEEDGAQEQGEHGLPQEPVPHLQGSGDRQEERAGEDMQAQEEDESLATIEYQSSGANVQLIAEGDELKSTSGESTEADLQPLSQTDSMGTGQVGNVAPDVFPLDQEDKAELVEMEAEDSWTDTQLCVTASPETPQGEGHCAAVQTREGAGDWEQGQGQGQDGCGLMQELLPHLSGVTIRQRRGTDADVQPVEEVVILDTMEDQSSGANVQLIAEGDELSLTPGGSTETDLQPLGEAGSSGTEQGGRLDSDVQPLNQVVKAELVEMEAEDAQADLQLSEGLSSGVPQGGETGTNVEIEEEENGAQEQGEHGLPHEPVLDLQGSGAGQGEGAGEDMQAQEEAQSLGTMEDQSSGANVQLIAEGDELSLTPGGSTETDLQHMGEAGSSGTEQGGRLDSDVQPLDEEGKAELVEGEAEDAQEDMIFHEGPSPGAPWGWEGGRAVQLEEEEEDGAQEQGEHGLPQEPVPHLQGSGDRQEERAGEDMQAQEEDESLATIEYQSSGANVQLIAEGDELKSASGESTEADLQPLSQTDSMGTGQVGNVAPDVFPLDQEDKAELVEMEAEDSWTDTQLCVTASPETPQGEGHCAAVQTREGAGDWGQEQGQGQDGCGLMQELLPHLSGVTIRQRRGTDADVQPVEEVVILDTMEDQSSGANVQLIAEGDELSLTPGGSTETDLQHMGEAGSSGTEQGGRLDSDVQPLDEEGKAELVEGEAEDAQADLQLSEGLSPEAPWGGEGGRAVQDEEDGAEGQGENRLPQESVLGPEGARGQQGQGAGAGVQPQEEAESLDTLEAQSTNADVQLFTDQQEPKSASGESTEADLTPLGAPGMWEGEQILSLGLEAVLGPSPTANPWQGAAAADVPPPTEAALCHEPVTAAEGSGLEAKLGTCIDPEGQILEAQELLQGERAPAEEKSLDEAQGLEVAQGERLEAGVRDGVKTQGLGLNQGQDDAELASLVSEVPLQTSPQKLETMMQEDVLIPDVWRLCAPGQAAQGELQEQVSAQGHEGRLHTMAQQPEGETAATMEPQHTAAAPAERPKQEVPASTLPTVQPEGAGSDQLGMVTRDNSQGHRQLLGEQSKDPSAGQREKMQEFGQKTSQEGEPSPGEPGAVTAGGAGAATRGCPKAPLDPEHLYNVLFVGDSHVGKTSFLYRLHADTFNPHLAATVGLDYQIKTLVVDNKRFALRLWDSAGQERYRSMTKQFFRKADGVVLMYDITSGYSFCDVRYWLGCIQEAAEDGVAVLLLGNKTDCAAQRQVPTEEGECLAREHQLMFYECSAASGHNVFESMVSFIRLLKSREDELKNKTEEVPKAPQKKKGCCW